MTTLLSNGGNTLKATLYWYSVSQIYACMFESFGLKQAEKTIRGKMCPDYG